jgi:hypothetical protein
MNPPRSPIRRRLNAVSIARLMVALQDEAMTVHELRELVGLSLFTTRHYVLTLHREGGCHIAHWEQDKRGRYVTAAYRLGKKRDAVKPVLCNAERQRRARLRAKQVQTMFALAA